MSMSELLDQVVAHVPVALHRLYKAGADEAVLDVGRRAARSRYTRQEYGMALYPELEAVLRDAATSSGLTAEQRHTVPAGGSYSIVQAGIFAIGRYSGPFPKAFPKRRAGYRLELVRPNRWIDPQGDFLAEFEAMEVDPGQRFACYVTVPSYRTRTCAHIGLGVLAPDLRRWIEYWSIEEVLAAYTPTEAVSDRAVAVVVDRAIPRLKKN